MPLQRRIDRVVELDEHAARNRVPLHKRDRVPRDTVGMKKWLERVEGRFMGMPLDVPPHEAILWAMRVTAGEVFYCDEQIRRLGEDELFERPARTSIVEMPSGGVEEVTEHRDPEVFSRWVQWRQSATERMARYAKMALDVGIEERQIQLAEHQAEQLVQVISAVLTDLGHDLKDIRTREVVRRRLLEGAAIEGTSTPIPDDAA